MSSSVRYELVNTIGALWEVRAPDGSVVATLCIEATRTDDPRHVSIDIHPGSDEHNAATRVLHFINDGATATKMSEVATFETDHVLAYNDWLCADIQPRGES